MIEYFTFSVITGLIVRRFSCCFAFITLCNGLKMSEYEVYWLRHYLLISIAGCTPRIINSDTASL